MDEHQNAWERLNFLSRLTLPQGYGGQVNYVQPPIIQLTMGDIYHKRSAFISGKKDLLITRSRFKGFE